MRQHNYDTGIVIIIIIAMVMGLFVVNWSLTFYKLWTEFHTDEIAIRRPKSVLLFGICCSFALLIRNPVTFYFSLNEKLFTDLFWLQTFGIHLTTAAIIYMLLYRTWLVYFYIKFNQSLENLKWQSQIDTKTLKQSWYIQKKQFWGNPKKIALMTFTPWLIFCIVGTLATFLTSNRISLLALLFSIIFGIIILSIICFKMPKYNDYYKLRVETKILSITYICLILSQFILTWILQTRIGQWKYIILQLFHISGLFTVGYISFYWVFKKFRLPTFVCYVDKSVSSKQLSDLMDGQNSPECTMKDILKDEELFMQFARHLSAEFAIENLIFFIESFQFANYTKLLLSELDTTDSVIAMESNPSSSSLPHIVITDKAPQSTIVAELKEKKNEAHAVYIAAINLYLKYIDVDAYYSINISYEARQVLSELFGTFSADDDAMKQRLEFLTKNNVQTNEICAAFDESRTEIYRLLASSVLRFRHTRRHSIINV